MKKLFLLTTAACLLLASLAGCTAETPPLPNEAESDDGLCAFTLSTGSRVSVETRSISETAIDEVWVVQLNKAGSAALTAPQHLTPDAAGKIRAKLEKEDSKVYFFANTGNATLFNPAAALSTFTTSVVGAVEMTHEGNWGARSNIPMYGTWEGTPQVPALTGNSADKVELAPVLARVNVSLSKSSSLSDKFSVETIQLRNVPNKTLMMPPSGSTYPGTSGTGFSDNSAIILSAPSSGAGNFVFYMPENCRGIGPERYETEKNSTLLSGGEYATYLEVYCLLSGGTVPVDIYYCFYLGANNINDYNVRRGYLYTVNIVISGTNPADTRVTIDGTAIVTGGGATIDKDWGSTNDAGSVDLGINS